jgi:DNA-binding Lrp family transcriptional regulator
MAIRAYVLVQAEVGKTASVAEAIRQLQGVSAADEVTGPYDVIVRIQAPTLDELGRGVISPIQTVNGVMRTFTCLVVNL